LNSALNQALKWLFRNPPARRWRETSILKTISNISREPWRFTDFPLHLIYHIFIQGVYTRTTSKTEITHEQLESQTLFTNCFKARNYSRSFKDRNYVNWDDLSGPTNWSHMYLLCLDHRRWWAWRVESKDVHKGKPPKKQNQQDYAASQELDERSVSKCVFHPNPNVCILLMENARN
jgi:hypothetical protein